ncbi:uncharacterized protein LOC131432451 [Malaya genurostris]|uniref:uncharacterized protein LOC131432451 n=1 Tax=Malaya genurostris TaxID=325434 RepID=UPI0026F3C363|nr:uncharacterized protein LOC131432451 [Malaya genurostris]
MDSSQSNVLTTSQLNDCLSACGYKRIKESLASMITDKINASFSDPKEACMFLAHLFHESGGFQYREEKTHTNAPYGYYYGRGYIQLTWEDNYRQASKALFGDDRLVQNPNLVSKDSTTSMRVSVWFWEKKVRPKAKPFNDFYLTTKAINGELENSRNHPTAKRRFKLYCKILEELGQDSSSCSVM